MEKQVLGKQRKGGLLNFFASPGSDSVELPLGIRGEGWVAELSNWLDRIGPGWLSPVVLSAMVFIAIGVFIWIVLINRWTSWSIVLVSFAGAAAGWWSWIGPAALLGVKFLMWAFFSTEAAELDAVARRENERLLQEARQREQQEAWQREQEDRW